MFSLSHLGLVATVVAIVVAAWKCSAQERRRGGARPQPRPKSIQRQLLKIAVLLALFVGALTPAFSAGEAGQYIHIACTIGLAALAYMCMFPKGEY